MEVKIKYSLSEQEQRTLYDAANILSQLLSSLPSEYSTIAGQEKLVKYMGENFFILKNADSSINICDIIWLFAACGGRDDITFTIAYTDKDQKERK